jgi:predicted ATPase
MAGLEEGPIRIRVGIHTGTPGLDPPKYVGLDVHFAARVMGSAHGGQVVVSAATGGLLEPSGSEPRAFSLLDLGEHRLKDIPEPVSLYQLGEGSFPPLKTISNTNLPRPASSFLGRETELAEVLARIEAGARLLTLTGPGGTGKTRLALEAASALVPSYKAGVFWVGLATLRDPALLTETIAQTLGAKDGLAAHIGERELMLLLDNLEQVIDGAPELSGLLWACSNLTLLVTSRELLRVQGEVEYPVPPLAAPEAVSLFCERAQIEPSKEISELCARLDSLPLAVELAAARTKALSPIQILERLSQRLDLLKGGRDADPRQQTLRATIEWSYDLLSSEEQQLFARLAVFAGGCTLDAAEEVADADLDTLHSLVEKSLLRFTSSDAGPRYWMLETIREYALGKLDESGEAEVVGSRHARYHLKLAEEGEPGLVGADDRAWLERLDAERDNFRAASAFANEQRLGEVALRLVAALRMYWSARGSIAELRRWLDEALESAGESLPEQRADALQAAALNAYWAGDYEQTERYGRQMLEIARQLGDTEREVSALTKLGAAASGTGQLDRSRTLMEAALRMARELGKPARIALSLSNLAAIALQEGAFARAAELCEESLAIGEHAVDSSGVSAALLSLAEARLHLGDPQRAAEAARKALQLAADRKDPRLVAEALSLVSGAVAAEDALVAARLIGASAKLREVTGATLGPSESAMNEELVHSLRREVGDRGFAEAFEQGQELGLAEAVELGLRAWLNSPREG